jgi:hypothetical protein
MTDYKDKYSADQSRERDCGMWHESIEEAIVHAERNMNCSRIPMMAYRGTTPENLGVVVGWALSPRKRWRLDYSERPGPTGEPPRWVHVNEEDFDRPFGLQKVVHRVNSRSFLQVSLYYRKWGSAFGSPRIP